MKDYLWIPAVAMLFTACEKEAQKNDDIKAGCSYYAFGPETKSYIVHYSDFENLSLNFGSEHLPVMQEGDLFQIDFSRQTICAEIDSEDKDKKLRFEALSTKNSDTDYDYASHRNTHQRTFIFFTAETDYTCFAENFVSVDFITENAWDEAHPAGSSINDLVMCREVRTKYRYIRSNYSDESLLKPINNKLVKDMTPDDWRCLSAADELNPKFSFVSMPTNPDCYYYTIKLQLTTDTSRTIACSSQFTYYTN